MYIKNIIFILKLNLESYIMHKIIDLVYLSLS